MNEHYDIIILGTGLKECILSGLLSVSGRKVLHLDRNDFYGGESGSFNLQQIKQHLDGLNEEDAKNWSEGKKELLGSSKQYNIDLCPKFIMSSGELVKILLKTRVTRYLEFKCVDGSYYLKGGKLMEVPVTPSAVAASPIMGINAKRRFKTFLQYCMNFDENDRSTHLCDGGTFFSNLDVTIGKTTPAEVYEWHKIDDDGVDFTGHAISLFTNNNYLQDPKQLVPMIKGIKLYAESLAKYEKSPYIYPLWGLGGLPEGFSRLAAVHGGVYMLRKPVANILYGEDGKVNGIETESNETATCDVLIGDPSYFDEEKVQPSGWICRVICILGAAIPGTKPGFESSQIIISSNENKNHNADIYISCISKGLECAPQNRFVAVISTRVADNDEAKARQLLAPALKLVQPVLMEDSMWMRFRQTFIPVNQEHEDNVYIPSSMDATTHFQMASREVKNIYEAVTGERLDLNTMPSEEDVGEN